VSTSFLPLLLPSPLNDTHKVVYAFLFSLSWVALIRPFTYQSVVIPILPNSMFSFLEAPVPFIVGVASTPSELPNDVVSVYIKQNAIKSAEPIPLLPNIDVL
jgi:hypothetical protein